MKKGSVQLNHYFSFVLQKYINNNQLDIEIVESFREEYKPFLYMWVDVKKQLKMILRVPREGKNTTSFKDISINELNETNLKLLEKFNFVSKSTVSKIINNFGFKLLVVLLNGKITIINYGDIVNESNIKELSKLYIAETFMEGSDFETISKLSLYFSDYIKSNILSKPHSMFKHFTECDLSSLNVDYIKIGDIEDCSISCSSGKTLKKIILYNKKGFGSTIFLYRVGFSINENKLTEKYINSKIDKLKSPTNIIQENMNILDRYYSLLFVGSAFNKIKFNSWITIEKTIIQIKEALDLYDRYINDNVSDSIKSELKYFRETIFTILQIRKTNNRNIRASSIKLDNLRIGFATNTKRLSNPAKFGSVWSNEKFNIVNVSKFNVIPIEQTIEVNLTLVACVYYVSKDTDKIKDELSKCITNQKCALLNCI